MILPYGPRVAIEDPPAEEQRASGLILPAGYSHLNRGIVISVGSGVEHLGPGCLVFYHGGCELELGKIKIINATCILAWEEA